MISFTPLDNAHAEHINIEGMPDFVWHALLSIPTNSGFLIEFEIVSCIVVGDILYHAAEYLIVVGQQALLYIISEDVAEQTTEIFMTWITQERTRIGEHSYETAEQTKHWKGKSVSINACTIMLLPLQGALHRFIIPRAMPWAMCSLPLRGVPWTLVLILWFNLRNLK